MFVAPSVNVYYTQYTLPEGALLCLSYHYVNLKRVNRFYRQQGSFFSSFQNLVGIYSVLRNIIASFFSCFFDAVITLRRDFYINLLPFPSCAATPFPLSDGGLSRISIRFGMCSFILGGDSRTRNIVRCTCKN